ncbi:flagellar hook-associated protein FlgK [Acetobacterium paludosum]|uniref:Flagellar hook-associated protein 1 n=1 Tax=Acetobacterium paludosum TaxID=52693 RepID=A0A923HU33_9FIRM|nr:flagellar hook-associated protein FlgK [Acetobacterium paludosum]MBC3888629.1 flagellar hook-associated protein FlgK [Acetobacterium paludosum]
MAGSFVSFQVASRALEASQASINVTGNNIANVNTDGYTRQRVDVNAVTSSGATEKYANNEAKTGLGAEAVRTTQTRDAYLDTRYRNQNAETSSYNTKVSGLTDLQSVFDEADTAALQSELSSFTKDLQTFSQTPTSSDIAETILASAQKVTQYINMYADRVAEVKTEQVQNLDIAVNSDFNTDVKNIASLNGQIREEEIHGNTPNDLYDQRNSLIDKLSSVAAIKVSSTPEKISNDLTISNLSISITDPTTNKSITIVDKDKYGALSYKDDTATDTISLSMTDAKGNDQTNVNNYFSNGTVKGYLDILNGKGSYATGTENTAQGISYYSKTMDIFANKFASVLNDINANVTTTITNTDGTTTSTVAPGTAKPLFTSSDGSSTNNITAANIQVSSAWLKNATYITTTPTTASTTSGSNDNILRMVSAMNDDQKFDYTPEGSTTKSIVFTGSYNKYMTSLLTGLSTDVKLNTSFQTTAKSVLATINTSRESVSGVSLNEEGVNLTAYQKVYNAAVKYFNILDENLDKIINTMGT